MTKRVKQPPGRPPGNKTAAMRAVERVYGKPLETVLRVLRGRHDSTQELSDELGVSSTTARRWLLRFGLSTPYMRQERHRQHQKHLPGDPGTHGLTNDLPTDTTLTLAEGAGQVTFPRGCIPSGTLVSEFQTAHPSQLPRSLVGVGPYVELRAIDFKTGVAVAMPFDGPYGMTLTYQASVLEAAGIRPQQLGFYHVDASMGIWVADASTVDPAKHTVSAQLRHMTEFALLADVSPPTTTALLSGSIGPDGAYAHTVSVTLTAVDAAPGSGVSATYYQVVAHRQAAAPESWLPYRGPFEVQEEGDWDVYVFSVDNAGNAEAAINVGRVRIVNR